MNKVLAALAGVVTTVVAGVAAAAPQPAIDVTDAVVSITNQAVPVALLAGAGLAVGIIIITWRWVRKAVGEGSLVDVSGGGSVFTDDSAGLRFFDDYSGNVRVEYTRDQAATEFDDGHKAGDSFTMTKESFDVAKKNRGWN